MRNRGRVAVRVVIDNSLLLIVGTCAALLWANVDPRSYSTLTHPLHFVVNDVGMAFFFALAAKEVFEATLPGGALSSRREAAVPLFAAAGGMIVPATVYLAFVGWNGEQELAPGWAIPCATDIAFSYMAGRAIFGVGHPAIPFLLLLAIADDALGLLVLAVFYPSGAISPGLFALLLVPALALAWWLRRRGTTSFWPYLALPGSLSWLAWYWGGFHPALALVPVIPFMPHALRDAGLFDPNEAHRADTLNAFEHRWKVPVQIILFFFGLVNAGVQVSSVGQVTWYVLIGLLLGKPIGIAGLTLVAGLMRVRRPAGLGYRDVLVVGLIAGIGFTVSLFFATAAFPEGRVLDEAKMGALLSFVAAPIGLLVARLLGIRRMTTAA